MRTGQRGGGRNGSGELRMARAEGLMAFYADIDPENVEDYRRWHNCEHMEERVRIPGFLRGRRYRGYDGAPGFLMSYETETAAVLGSPAYHAALNAPTAWTKRALTWFRNPVRSIYGLLAETGEVPWRAAPYLLAARFNVPADAEPAFLSDLGPALLRGAVDGAAVPRARLYAIDEAISAMMTSERKIYGGGPGNQKFLVLVEAMAPFAEIPAGRMPDAATFASVGATDLFLDLLSIDFALEAPVR